MSSGNNIVDECVSRIQDRMYVLWETQVLNAILTEVETMRQRWSQRNL